MFSDEPARADRQDNGKQVSWRLLGVLVACGLTASCSSTSDFGTALGLNELSPTGRAAGQSAVALPETTETAAADGQSTPSVDSATAPAEQAAPQKLALAYPTPRPSSLTVEKAEAPVATSSEPAVVAAPPGSEQQPASIQPEQAEVARPLEPQQAAEASPVSESTPAKKRGFFASLFGGRSEETKSETTAKAAVEPATSAPTEPRVVAARPAEQPVQPQVQLSSFNVESVAPAQKKVIINSRSVANAYAANALPGVRTNSELFDVVRKSGGTDDSDVDLYEEEGSYQVASAMGLARLAPHGLLKQRPDVDTSCFKPRLVSLLKKIERHYGKPVIVTSGYRSPEHNRRVRGARKSAHMDCAAADIQVPGVSRWELARFARSLPGRGGVGTYCHTASVHVDVGAERDWNWRCRR